MLELNLASLGRALDGGAGGSEFGAALAFFLRRVTIGRCGSGKSVHAVKFRPATGETTKAGAWPAFANRKIAFVAYLQASICFRAADMPDSE